MRNLALERLLELGETVETLMKHTMHAATARIVMILFVQLLEQAYSVETAAKLSVVLLSRRCVWTTQYALANSTFHAHVSQLRLAMSVVGSQAAGQVLSQRSPRRWRQHQASLDRR